METVNFEELCIETYEFDVFRSNDDVIARSKYMKRKTVENRSTGFSL